MWEFFIFFKNTGPIKNQNFIFQKKKEPDWSKSFYFYQSGSNIDFDFLESNFYRLVETGPKYDSFEYQSSTMIQQLRDIPLETKVPRRLECTVMMIEVYT